MTLPTQPSDEELREQLQDLFINEHQRGFETCAEGTGNWSDSNLRRAMALIRQDREATEQQLAILKSDIAYAIGCFEGLGYPSEYLKARYSDLGLTHKQKEK